MTGLQEITATLQQKSIEKASRSKNPIQEAFPEFAKFSKDDMEVALYCKTKADMDSKTIKWAFKLAEKNVGSFYKTCSMGWQPKIKQSDLNKNWARYLVAVDKQRNPVAYAMFRFDMDYGSNVLYCYEMQIEKSCQRRGLGKFMMTALERCAQFYGMEKVILTVLKNNPDGMAFFENLGYSIDDSSPDKSEKADYEILSKTIT